VNLAQLNLLDSHDVPRALHMLQGDVKALQLALVLLFCLPGTPCLYYGTEVGLHGGEEPGCREAFPWDGPTGWRADLRAFIASLAALRRAHGALCSGTLQLAVLPGSEGDQGLLLQRQGHDTAIDASITTVINRNRRAPLRLDHPRLRQSLPGEAPWAVVWPAEHRAGPMPEQLGPQSAVVLQRRPAQP
jgi:neopullulanase